MSCAAVDFGRSDQYLYHEVSLAGHFHIRAAWVLLGFSLVSRLRGTLTGRPSISQHRPTGLLGLWNTMEMFRTARLYLG